MGSSKAVAGLVGLHQFFKRLKVTALTSTVAGVRLDHHFLAGKWITPLRALVAGPLYFGCGTILR